MTNFEKFPYFFDEDLKLIAYCPLCDADLNPLQVKVIEDKQDSHLVHIQCPKCKGFILALVLKTATGVSSVGIITDLNFNDVYNFKDKVKMTADEIIDIHEAINKRSFVKQIIKDKN